VLFDEEFTPRFVAKKSQELFDKCKDNKPILLIMDTPGGSVIAGIQFIDFVKSLPCRVDTLTITAMSMGYITVQLLAKRMILKSGILLTHYGSFHTNSPNITDFILDLHEMVNLDVAKRLGITVAKYNKLLINDTLFTSKKAVELNHADEIVTATCDKSLKGTKKTTISTFFGEVTVIKSKCPLISGILDVAAPNEKAKVEALKQIESTKYIFNDEKNK
jgi:ATP-dependent protease ClpP protease subunit